MHGVGRLGSSYYFLLYVDRRRVTYCNLPRVEFVVADGSESTHRKSRWTDRSQLSKVDLSEPLQAIASNKYSSDALRYTSSPLLSSLSSLFESIQSLNFIKDPSNINSDSGLFITVL